MHYSTAMLAKLLGLLYITVALGILLDTTGYRRIFNELLGSHVLTYLSGLLALVAGLLIVLMHNHWSFSWSVAVTIIGWLALIKGALLIIHPNTLIRISEPFLRRDATLRYTGVGALLLGLFLTILGFGGF
jgi:uncharacterized membrane protein